MRKIGNLINLAFGLCLFPACSPDVVDVTYYCEPSGAKIFEDGIGGVGTCPMTLRYNTYDDKIRDDKLFMNKIVVVWPSGASVLQPPTTLDIPANRKTYLTFTRPENFPYSERDQKFSTAYNEGIHPQEYRYVVSLHQDRDLFAALDRSATCFFSGVFQSVDAQCP